jgi:hypothetical protein
VHGAFFRLYCMERACELEMIARQMDEEPVEIEPHVVQRAAERMKAIRDTETYGLMEWEGIVRTVERAGADFRRPVGQFAAHGAGSADTIVQLPR